MIYYWFLVVMGCTAVFESMKIPNFPSMTQTQLAVAMPMVLMLFTSFCLWMVMLARKPKSNLIFWGLFCFQIRFFLVPITRGLQKSDSEVMEEDMTRE
mmetsp:Transcript_2742/g.4292  ORF Transcript_2742/g.4292 Transcript_2742/m.4292 type:complete len:98 (-) Transcript_2742:1523-1816(-)